MRTLWCVQGLNNRVNVSVSAPRHDIVSLTQRQRSPPPRPRHLTRPHPAPTSGCGWVFWASQTLTDWLMDWTAVSWWDYRNAASSSGDAAAKRNIQQPQCQPLAPPQPTQESQTLGKLTLGWRRGEGKPLAKPSEIFLLLSLLFRFCLCPPPIPRPEFFGSASNPRRPHGFSRSHYSQWGCKDFQIKVKDFSLWRKHEGRGGRLEGGGGVRACQAMWEPSRNARSWIRMLLSFQVSKTWRKGGPIQTTAGGFTQKCCTFPALHLSDSFS